MLDYENLLKGRYAVITQCHPVVARETALLYAQNGAQVCVVEKDPETGAETLRQLREISSGHVLYTACPADAAELCGLCSRIKAGFGAPDILVTGTWLEIPGTVESLSDEDMEAMLWADVKAPMLYAREFVGGMKEKRLGNLIQIGYSLAGAEDPGTAGLAVASSALAGFGRSASMDYIRYHVRANTILAGYGMTEAGKALDEAGVPRIGPEQLTELRGMLNTPGKAGTAWDIACAALYFACDLCRFVAGETLTVDGGAAVRNAKEAEACRKA